MTRARLVAGVVALAATVVPVGCGEGERRPPSAPTFSIRLDDFDLQPEKVRVKRPGPVLFQVRNEGRQPHSFAIGSPPREKTDPIPPGAGATVRIVFSEPGEYPMYCPLVDHRERGMRGVVEVEDG